MNKSLQRFIEQMPVDEKNKALLAMAERLIELEEVSFHMEDIDQDEALFWSASGEYVGK